MDVDFGSDMKIPNLSYPPWQSLGSINAPIHHESILNVDHVSHPELRSIDSLEEPLSDPFESVFNDSRTRNRPETVTSSSRLSRRNSNASSVRSDTSSQRSESGRRRSRDERMLEDLIEGVVISGSPHVAMNVTAATSSSSVAQASAASAITMKPLLNRGPFSPTEDALMIRCHFELGNKWMAISELMKLYGFPRADTSIKSRWGTLKKNGVMVDNGSIIPGSMEAESIILASRSLPPSRRSKLNRNVVDEDFLMEVLVHKQMQFEQELGLTNNSGGALSGSGDESVPSLPSSPIADPSNSSLTAESVTGSTRGSSEKKHTHSSLLIGIDKTPIAMFEPGDLPRLVDDDAAPAHWTSGSRAGAGPVAPVSAPPSTNAGVGGSSANHKQKRRHSGTKSKQLEPESDYDEVLDAEYEAAASVSSSTLPLPHLQQQQAQVVHALQSQQAKIQELQESILSLSKSLVPPVHSNAVPVRLPKVVASKDAFVQTDDLVFTMPVSSLTRIRDPSNPQQELVMFRADFKLNYGMPISFIDPINDLTFSPTSTSAETNNSQRNFQSSSLAPTPSAPQGMALDLQDPFIEDDSPFSTY
jgi:Myb-like DNA-binding domain